MTLTHKQTSTAAQYFIGKYLSQNLNLNTLILHLQALQEHTKTKNLTRPNPEMTTP